MPALSPLRSGTLASEASSSSTSLSGGIELRAASPRWCWPMSCRCAAVAAGWLGAHREVQAAQAAQLLCTDGCQSWCLVPSNATGELLVPLQPYPLMPPQGGCHRRSVTALLRNPTPLHLPAPCPIHRRRLKRRRRRRAAASRHPWKSAAGWPSCSTSRAAAARGCGEAAAGLRERVGCGGD